MVLNINNNMYTKPVVSYEISSAQLAFKGKKEQVKRSKLTPEEVEALKIQKLISVNSYESMPDIVKALFPRSNKQSSASITAINNIRKNINKLKDINNDIYIVVKGILDNRPVDSQLAEKCKNLSDENVKKLLGNDEDFYSYKMLVESGQSPESTKEISSIYIKTKNYAEKNVHTLFPLKAKDDAIKEVSSYFAENKQKVINAIILGGDNNIRTLLPRNFEQVKGYIEDCNNISKNKEAIPLIYDICHKKGLENGLAIKFLKVAFAYNNINPDEFNDKLKTLKNDDIKSVMQNLRKDLTKEVYRDVLSPEEFENLHHSACDRVDLDYLSELLKVSKEPPFKEVFRAMATGDMNEVLNNETNTKTKELFGQNGIDYDKWLNYKNSLEFKFQLTAEEVKQSVLNNVKLDLTQMKKSSSLGNEFFSKLNESGFSAKNLDKMDLKEFKNFIGHIIKTIDNINGEIEFREEKKHFIKRLAEINSFENVGNNDSAIKLKIWDRCPERDILIGGKAQSCLSLENKKRSALADYLTNTMFNFVEIQDNEKTIGFSRIYFANTDKNQKALIIDATELKTGFQGSNLMREKLVQYCKTLVKDVSGKDLPVYIGGGYCNIPTTDLPKVSSIINIIGEGQINKKFYINAICEWIDVKNSFKTVLYDIGKIVR